jgi:antirestriction protein ArdC
MNRTDALKLCSTALKELESQLAAGKSETLVRFMTAMATFHDYSFRNIHMILAQRPDATNVAGFRAWNRLNRYVRKGEKGIAIFAPMVFKENQELKAEGEDRTRVGFRVVHVFDVSQTEGEPLPTLEEVRGDPASHLGRLKHAVREAGIALEYHASLGAALGQSCGGLIKLEEGLSPAREYSVIAHELAHELLHRGSDRGQTTKKQRELEAESVAFVLCKYAGLESSTAHADYIQLFTGDADALTRSLDAVQRTASHIIEAMTESAEKLAA